jgi:hypothetical protein
MGTRAVDGMIWVGVCLLSPVPKCQGPGAPSALFEKVSETRGHAPMHLSAHDQLTTLISSIERRTENRAFLPGYTQILLLAGLYPPAPINTK